MEADRKKIWQTVFLLGIAACVGAAVLAFGLSALAIIITGGSILTGVLNGLFYRPNANDAGTSWLVARLAHILSVNKFLKTAAAGMWALSAILGVFGLRQVYVDSVTRAIEAQKVTVEGLVLTAGGDPADNAVVTLSLSRGQQVVTAPGGKFTFAKVDIRGEPSKTVRIHARWRTHEAEISADLSGGSPQGLFIKLPPGDPPFRVTYFVLEAHAIDFLLQQKISAKWEEKLGGQPFIVPNEVSATISDLVNNFSEETGYSFYEIENKGKKSEEDLSESGSGKLFIGGGIGSAIYISDPTELIRSLEDPQQSWRIFYSKQERSTVIESLIFRKFISPRDLNLFEDTPMKKFYKHITKEYMPPDFGHVSIYYLADDGCGADDTGIRYAGTHFIGRSLSLRIAVVENVSNDPISLGNFTVKVNRSDRLRSRQDDSAQLAAQPAEKRELFPQKMLSPGEKIVIPMEMPLSYKKNEFFDYVNETPVNQNIRSNVASELTKIDQINFPIYERNSPFTVSARTVENILNRPATSFALNKEYLYGPSMSVESVDVDNVNFPFRQFDPTKLVIKAGDAIGSCPYVYTYSAKDEAWINEGVVLYGVNESRKEKIEEKRLTRFDGRVRIRERDPEDSFIDAVYVKALLPGGGEIILRPEHRAVRSADGQYLKLRQGEEVELKFNLPRGLTATEYVLGVEGYYIPYKQVPTSRQPQLRDRKLGVGAIRLTK